MLAAAALLACAWAQAADVRAMRSWASAESTRVVFDLSGPVDYKLFDLSDPDRVVVELRGSRFIEGMATPELKGLLKSVRVGRHGKTDARAVFDLGNTVRPKSFLLAPDGKNGHRLVLDFFPKTAKAATAPVRKLADALPNAGGRDVVIAIDAGHGGKDPGAIGASGHHEKQITLAAARELKRQIDREPGMSAFLVRDGDYYIVHKERYEKARRERADLFVSIHADACPGNCTARGSSVWVMSPRGASSEMARRLADRENADLVGGVSLDDKEPTLAAVLLDLQQGATMSASNLVADQVLAALRQNGPTHQNYVERANFIVLRSPDVPSILVELGFISNAAEEKRLKDADERRKIAASMVEGIRNYFRISPPDGSLFAMNARNHRASRHVVGPGETLAVIANRHRTDINALRAANNINGNHVRVGDVLRIPAL